MLNFNVMPTERSLAEPAWKVLIYDEIGQDIISPLLTVQDLRANAVTLHLFVLFNYYSSLMVCATLRFIKCF